MESSYGFISIFRYPISINNYVYDPRLLVMDFKTYKLFTSKKIFSQHSYRDHLCYFIILYDLLLFLIQKRENIKILSYIDYLKGKGIILLFIT